MFQVLLRDATPICCPSLLETAISIGSLGVYRCGNSGERVPLPALVYLCWRRQVGGHVPRRFTDLAETTLFHHGALCSQRADVFPWIRGRGPVEIRKPPSEQAPADAGSPVPRKRWFPAGPAGVLRGAAPPRSAPPGGAHRPRPHAECQVGVSAVLQAGSWLQ